MVDLSKRRFSINAMTYEDFKKEIDEIIGDKFCNDFCFVNYDMKRRIAEWGWQAFGRLNVKERSKKND